MKNGKTRKEALGVVGVLLCALGANVLRGAERGERIPIGEFTAARLDRSPTVDGIVTEGEWDRALMTSGLITPFEHQLQESETTMGLAFDQERFYFLFLCRRGNHEWKLWKRSRLNDDYNFGEPSVEVWVTPPTLVPETYQSILNTYPAVFDVKMIPSRGYSAQGWKGNWTVAVRENETQYVVEASVPIRDFGFEGIRDGDGWRFLLCRNCVGAKPRSQASWSVTQGFSEIPQHPTVRLRDDEAVVQLRGVSSLLSGRYDLGVTVVAPRSRPADVEVEVRFQAEIAPGSEDRVETRRVSLPAGGRGGLSFSGDLADQARGYLAVKAVKSDGCVLFRQTFPYAVTGWQPQVPQRPANQPPPEELAVTAQYGPETSVLLVQADILDLPQREQVAQALVTVVNAADGKPLVRDVPMRPFVEWYASATVPVPASMVPVEDFPRRAKIREEIEQVEKENRKKKPGETLKPVPEIPRTVPRKAQVIVTVRDAEGRDIRTATREVELLRYQAEWLNHSVGMTDRVIPPWTPVRVGRDGVVEVWNRRLELDGLGLARAVRNGETDQLAAPMRLVVVQDGRPLVAEAGDWKLARRVDAEADLVGEAHVEGLKLGARTRVEFDGFVRVDLSVAPAGSAPVRVERLYLEVTLPASEATHFCTTAGGWAAIHDELPERWTSQSTASGMLAGDFVPYLWLSNSDRAFLWFADSDRGWTHDPDRALPTQEVIRQGDRVVLRVHFIEIPDEVLEPRTITWGWQTFPSRPLPPGWRATFCAQNPPTPHTRNTYFWTDADWAVLWPYYCSPYPWSFEKSRRELLRTPLDSIHRPCVGSIAHSIGRYRDYEGNEFKGLAVDWGATPGVIGNADVTSSRGPNDFRLWHYQRWVQEARFRGLYVDENYLGLEENFLTGNAYWRADGRLQRAYNYLGLREYFKRLKVMFHQNQVPPPNLWQHVSSGAAYHAWFGDIFFEGENVEPTDLVFDYIEVLPAGRMRAIGSSVCAGGVMTMMCQSQRHPTVHEPKHTHQYLGWVMAHDVLPEQHPLYPLLVEAGHLWREDVEFLPYWKPGGPFSAREADALVSAHRTPGRALLWVVNTNRADRAVAVSVDWSRANLDVRRCSAWNAETADPIALTAEGFIVTVPQRDFVPVLIADRGPLRLHETFVATFDRGAEADAAVSCAVLESLDRRGGAPALTDDGKGGAAALTEGGLRFRAHLHLADAEGRLTFRGLIPEHPLGSVVEIGRLSVAWVRARGQSPECRLILAGESGGEGTAVPAGTLPPGWHEFHLAWKDGVVRLKMDGAQAAEVRSPGLGLSLSPRKAEPFPSVLFNRGRSNGLTAVDDIRCFRAVE